MTAAPAAPAADAAEAFALLSDTVRVVADEFASRHRRDPDDTYGWACLFFVECLRDYDPGRGTLASRVVFYVRKRLVDQLRKEHGRNLDRPIPGRLRPAHLPASRDPLPFDREGLGRRLDPDARVVVDVLLASPADLEAAFRAAPRTDETGVRAALRRYLETALGWTGRRVDRSFRRIEKAIS